MTHEQNKRPTHAFLSPETLNEIADKIEALAPPGGMVAVYDPRTGSIAVMAVRDGVATNWSVYGRHTPEEAARELAAIERRHGFTAH